jgi:LEA14-like dessication related protein
MKYSHIINRLAIAALVLFVSGCTLTRFFVATLEKPTFTYLSFELVEVSQGQAMVNFVFSAHNPNDVGLKNMLVSYELFVEGKYFLKGNDIHLELPPKSDIEIKVPAVIMYADLLPVLGSVAERIVSGQKTIPLTVNAVFSKKPVTDGEAGDKRSLSFDMNMTKTVDLPLPQERINKRLNQLRDTLKQLKQ